jgi:PhnB protein
VTLISIQPELWVDRGAAAVAFYQSAFGATVLHRVGDGEDIVAQLAIGDAAFWVSTAGSAGERLNPKAIGGTTSRILLVVEDPDAVFDRAVKTGATAIAQPANEHGWRLARITDPFGQQWENRTPPGHLAAAMTVIAVDNRPCGASNTADLLPAAFDFGPVTLSLHHLAGRPPEVPSSSLTS